MTLDRRKFLKALLAGTALPPAAAPTLSPVTAPTIVAAKAAMKSASLKGLPFVRVPDFSFLGEDPDDLPRVDFSSAFQRAFGSPEMKFPGLRKLPETALPKPVEKDTSPQPKSLPRAAKPRPEPRFTFLHDGEFRPFSFVERSGKDNFPPQEMRDRLNRLPAPGKKGEGAGRG